MYSEMTLERYIFGLPALFLDGECRLPDEKTGKIFINHCPIGRKPLISRKISEATIFTNSYPIPD